MRTPLILVLSLFLAGSAAADLIVPQTSASRILIPIAGDAPGANGTYFRSDIALVNLRNAEQNVLLRWYPAGRSGEGVATRTLTIAPRSGVSSNDFVRAVMNQTGIGAIDIIGVTALGAFDPDAQLHASSRIWTPQPNVENGTMSQTFPALIFTSNPVPVKWIFGLHRGEQYRLNVGIVNPSNVAQRFRITIVTNTGARESVEVDVAALSIRQDPMIGTADVLQIVVENLTPEGAGTWQAWASSIDNVTGDAWSQMAFPAPSAQ